MEPVLWEVLLQLAEVVEVELVQRHQCRNRISTRLWVNLSLHKRGLLFVSQEHLLPLLYHDGLRGLRARNTSSRKPTWSDAVYV